MSLSLSLADSEAQAVSAREVAWQLYQTDGGWTEVSSNMEGDTVLEWRPPQPGSAERDDGVSPSVGWRCWRVRTTVEARKETVVGVLMDYDNMADWNPALSKTQVKCSEKLCLVQWRTCRSWQDPART